MLRATKYRIYPNRHQIEILNQSFGSARWVYNHALAFKTKVFNEFGKSLSTYDLIRLLPKWKRRYKWLKLSDSQVLQASIRNLGDAFINFFRRVRSENKKPGFPKFKSKNSSKHSIQYPQRVKIENNKIYLPKVGWVKIKLSRILNGKIQTVTVSKSPSGKYYASVLINDGREQPKTFKRFDEVIGIDMGLTDFLTDSFGNKISNPKHLNKHDKNLRRKQQKFSKKQKGSRNRNKARLLVAKCHERIANARYDFQHQVSRSIADENQAAMVEDLNVSGMLKNHKLARSISDVGWAGFITKLKYKLEEKGGKLVKVNRFFPSSKLCSVCGTINKNLKLSVRFWTCDCGAVHDRDHNAAINIRNEGIRILQTEGYPVSACGGYVVDS